MDISHNKNSIKIIYKNNENENEIGIFRNKFVNNNKNNCKILYKDQIYDLKNNFDVPQSQPPIPKYCFH